MRFLDFLTLFVLFVALLIGSYVLWLNFPSEPSQFEEYRNNANLSSLSVESQQFYQNLRYRDKTITYQISDACSQKKRNDFVKATKTLEEKTILIFVESDVGEIQVTCSSIAPEPKEKNHFIAGEGGPSEIINATKYSVILSGRIALYRAETCETPQVSTHELLHALGFDHNNNADSIMFPLTDCKQQIDESIIRTINSLYADPPYADLIIEKAVANKSGNYLNIDVTLANYGLKDTENSTLLLYADNTLVKEFEIGEFKIGTKRFLSATNIKIPRSTAEIQLSVETKEDEISKSNNLIKIKKLE